MEKLDKILNAKNFFFVLLLLLGLGVSIQALLEGTRSIAGGEYTHYNNYLIFKQSFYHLIGYNDLYAAYPKEHFDFFKYSPTFAILFGAFAILPDFLGLSLWNVTNLLVLLLALYAIPNFDKKWIGAIVLLSIFELVTTAQNEQSNTLMIAFFVLTFVSLERQNQFLACLFISLAIYTKLYAIVGLSLFILYPGKLKNALWLGVCMLGLFLLPLLAVDWHQLIFQYKSWFSLLGREHDQIYGISVMGWLHTWFKLNVHKALPVVFGVVLFCIPLLQFRKYKDWSFRILFLCSILIWVVIFNHRAESASYIIAYIGICIWFVVGQKNKLRIALMALCFMLVTISPTDLFPRLWREELVQAYTLKAVPVIVVWLFVIKDMMLTPSNKLEG